MRTALRGDLPKRLQPGTRVGKDLLIRSVLGRGGTAVVYEAQHQRLGVNVALKVAHAIWDEDRRIEREAEACSAIRDSRVPHIYDVSELDDGRAYLVMERIAGMTLEEKLTEGRLEPRLALKITRELLDALQAVHTARVVHRDIKPGNLMLRDHDGDDVRICLMDFGVSRLRARSETAQPCRVEGTPSYMAPEQISNEPVNDRTDLYATGVLLYEMLAGQAPFTGFSNAEVMAAVLRRDHTPLSKLRPDMPEAVAALVARAMAEQPGNRFSSASEMRDALDRVASELQRPSPLLTTGFPARHGSRVAVGFAALVGVAASLLVTFSSNNGSGTLSLRDLGSPMVTAMSQPAETHSSVAPRTSGVVAMPRWSVSTAAAVASPASAPEAEIHVEPRGRPEPRAKEASRGAHAVPQRRFVLSDYLRPLDGLQGVLAAPHAQPPQGAELADRGASQEIPENPYLD